MLHPFRQQRMYLRRESSRGLLHYGFDPIYDGNGDDDVTKSAITTDTVGATTEFTFTGFELFADCTADSGIVYVTVSNADGKSVSIDGGRITNTLADSTIYDIDMEDGPVFFQLRDYGPHHQCR